MHFFLISLNKLCYQSEYRLITVEADGVVVVVDCVVVLKGIALFVFQEDAWHMALCKRVVVAVGCQFSSVECLEVVFLLIYLFK